MPQNLSSSPEDRQCILRNTRLRAHAEKHFLLPHQRKQDCQYYTIDDIATFFQTNTRLLHTIFTHYAAEFALWYHEDEKLFTFPAILLWSFLLTRNPVAQGMKNWVLRTLTEIFFHPNVFLLPTQRDIPRRYDPLYHEKTLNRLFTELRQKELTRVLQRLQKY